MRPKVALGQGACCYCRQPFKDDDPIVGAGDGTRTGENGYFGHQLCCAYADRDAAVAETRRMSRALTACQATVATVAAERDALRARVRKAGIVAGEIELEGYGTPYTDRHETYLGGRLSAAQAFIVALEGD